MESSHTRTLLEPRRLGLIAIIVMLILLLMALGLPRLTGGDDENSGATNLERKQVMDPPKELANFTLTNQDGQPLSLSDLQGKPVLLFFGFTHCPDVCPTTMAEFRQIKRDLGDQGGDLAYVFVSVDGTRDTPEVLKPYLAQFDPAFIGLTGTEDKVRQIGGDYFVFFNHSPVEGTPSAAGYSVDHTSFTYLIDAEGKLRFIYPFQAPREMIVGDIQGILT